MITVTRVADVRRRCDEARSAHMSVGFVPTMGYFHEGHRSLMRAARGRHDLVVVSLFVNPLQFGPNEDLDAYPRDLVGDTAVAEAESVDVIFAPGVAEMYGEPIRTSIHVADLGDGMCGASRTGHFDGVATVVAKLFSIVGPCAAYFGRKDAQQLAIVRRMARDLSLPVEIVGCPIVREPDGLAMSSRNAYLTGPEREAAAVLFRALRLAAASVSAGERDAAVLVEIARAEIATRPLVVLEYAELRDAATLLPIARLDDEGLFALAARVGKARLVDNCTFTIHGAEVTTDLGGIATRTESEASCAAP